MTLPTPSSMGFRLIPQTFDLRPSRPAATGATAIDLPDELMIDWGKTPVGSVATIYWPQVDVSQVLRLATRIYSSNQLSRVDLHTLQCRVAAGASYIPIPPGAGQNLAGLFTVQLPPSVSIGQEFKIVVRRLSTRQVDKVEVARAGGRTAKLIANPVSRNWRYVVGTFQISIPVRARDIVLGPEEDTLAIMKWRLTQMSTANRWHPVLTRYIGYLVTRVNSLGGNGGAVGPSPWGAKPFAGQEQRPHDHTGKVIGVIYDRFGDFEGFLLLSETGEERRYRSREIEIERLVRSSWETRTVIAVRSDHHKEHIPTEIILLRRPTLPGHS